jgi:glycosyltransferase involved in cell wall biosynthesis
MKSRPLLFRPRHMLYLARREILRLSPPLPRRPGRRAFVVFDPSLIAFHGHHFEFAQLMKDELQSSFDVRFYCNLRAPLKIVRSLLAKPICDVGIYPVVEDFDETYRNNTASMVRALKRIDSDVLNRDTIFVVHTLTLYQLGGLSHWLATLPESRRPILCIQFQFPLEFLLPEEPTVRARAISLAQDAARELTATGRVRFASNSELLADHIAKQLSVPCTVLPLPVRWPNRRDTHLTEPGVVFGFFGGLRPEKGSAIIAQTIPAFAARHPDTKFIIHAPPSGSDFPAAAALARVPQVELLQQTFAEKSDYFEQFVRANCILLPYDAVQYQHRTSAILIEAIGLGRPVITTKDSWLQVEAERRGGKVFAMNDFSSGALFDSLGAAREYLGTRRAEPSLKRDVIDECSPSAFCSAIVQLADHPPDHAMDLLPRRTGRANAN